MGDGITLPTVWADLGRILPGAHPGADTAALPEKPVWDRLLGRLAAPYRLPMVFLQGDIPTTKKDTSAWMQYISGEETFSAWVRLRCQGTSSMAYPKKNFTIRLYADEARETPLEKVFQNWGASSAKYVLKANFIDHTHARNIVCARLWDEVVSGREDYDSLPEQLRRSPGNGAVDGFPVKVYTNGTYQGIYTWNIGKDPWLFGMDENQPNHALLCGETNTDGVYAENACNFRRLWSGIDQEDWEIEVGTNSASLKNSLNALIACVKDTDDETFKATIGAHLDIQSAIDYYIHQYVICGIDGLAKNMLLATYDGTKWFCSAYDMDATFGLTPQGGTATVRPDYACPEEYQERFSLLWERLTHCFCEEIKARYAQLRKSVYTFGNIVSRFEGFVDHIGQELLAEDATIYSIPSASTNNIRFLREFVRDRLAYTDAMIPRLQPGISATGVTLDKREIVFTAYAPVTLTATVTPADTTDAVVWSSDNPAVATVDGGVVTPVSDGQCTITARCGSFSAACSVRIDSANMEEELVWFDGYYLAGGTGEQLAGNPDDTCTDFISLRGATKIAGFSQSISYGRLHFYDEKKGYLSYIGAYHNTWEGAGNMQIPENAAYVRLYDKTAYKDSVTYLTDAFRNGFVQPDLSTLVPNKVPSQGGEAASNTLGYLDRIIPVQPGQFLWTFNSAYMDHTAETAAYRDIEVFAFDAQGNFLEQLASSSGDNAGNGQKTWIIPQGVAGVKLAVNLSGKDYAWYKVSV